MAADAITFFLQRDFAGVNQALLSLTEPPRENGSARPPVEDPRIRHNWLLSSFYQENTLQNLEDLVLFIASSLPTKQKPSSATEFISGIAEHGASLKQTLTHLGPVALYNLAVIAYHLGFVRSAAAVGDVLYCNVEAMDDWLALRTCFLLIDIHIRLCDVASALKVSAYAEKLLPNFSGSADGSNSSTEIKILAPQWPTRSKCILEQPTSYDDAKFCLHIYNARMSSKSEDPTDGLRNIRKEAKSAVLAADNSQARPTAAALLVKARVEPNSQKGLRILASIVSQSSPTALHKIFPLALNSLGILHHQLGCHALAACYFEHSRQAFLKLFSDEDKSVGDLQPYHLTSLSRVHDTHVAYNLALQYMQLSDFSKALDCFMICVRSDYTYANSSPRLWIRIAECCIGIERNSGRPLLAVEGQGRGRRFIMRATERDEGLNMEYAATCARAAIVILDRQRVEADEVRVSPSKAKRNSRILNSTPAVENGHGRTSSSFSSDEDVRLRSAALSILAYSSLSFDPKSVIMACKEIQKLFPNSNNDRTLLSRLYAAEAYCLLDRPNEAAEQLLPMVNSSIPDSTAREAAYINWALAKACSGDVAIASRAAKFALKPFSTMSASQQRYRSLRRDTIFAASYIFLRNGEIDNARHCLRSLLGST
ncbi:CCR4-NOT transcription complex subunit 10 [Gracilaria domingensis]|nr:CCR4-NOT transcription complex subunit 10 [Gracilaria domingensis]